MKSQPKLLTRLWRKLFPEARSKPAVRLSSTQQPLAGRDRLRERGIEPLEGRIAPAVLLSNGVDLKYTDLDGDHVTIHFSKSIFSAAPGGSVDTILGSVFTFSAGSAHTGATNSTADVPQALQLIDLTKVRPNGSVTPATGVSFTMSVEKVGTGDGLANVGAISASGLALGSIVVHGDLGQIDAGLSTAATAIQSLNVKTLGARTDTQISSATVTPSYESTIVGGIGSFTADSITGAYLHVIGASNSGAGSAAVGKIGTVTIAHYIKARDVSATATNDGLLETTGDIGTLTLGSGFRDAAHPDLSDGLNGGGGATSGSIKVGGAITKLIVNGDLRGSTGTSSASIIATGQIASLDVAGSLLGSGTSSATVTAGKLGTVVIGTVDGHGAAGTSDGRGLVGGTGDGSGVVKSNSTIASAIITNIQGSGANSGGLTASGAIGSVTVNGYVKGGASANSGFITSSSTLGIVKLLGELDGGAGANSGVVSGHAGITSFSGTSIVGAGLDSGGVTALGKIGNVTLSGSLTGGASQHSGYIDSAYSIANITIKGNVEGGAGVKSGAILSASSIGTVNITGHLKGGDATVTPATDTTPASSSGGDLSGSITSGTVGFGGITSVTLGGGLIGGTATGSGVISSAGNIGSVKITRVDAMSAPLDAIAGGAGDSSGAIYSFGNIGTVTVNGTIRGGGGHFSGTIREHGALKTVTVSGNLYGGNGDDSGGIYALDTGTPEATHSAGSLGTVNVLGAVEGGVGLRSGVVSSDGAITGLSVGALDRGTDVTSGQILAGAGLYGPGNIGALTLHQVGSSSLTGGSVLVYGTVGTLSTGNVTTGTIHVQDSIGALHVAGSLTDSTITAGGQALFNGKTDLAIGSIMVTGSVSGSSIKAGYGILNDAENGHAQIGTVKVTGSWLSSNLVAGVQDAGAAGFGDSGDQLISGHTSAVKARIASVAIGGALDATGPGQYGFVAQEIGAFQSARGTLALNATAGQAFTYTTQSGATVSIREVLPES